MAFTRLDCVKAQQSAPLFMLACSQEEWPNMETLTSLLISKINEVGTDASFFSFFVRKSTRLTFSHKYLPLPLFSSKWNSFEAIGVLQCQVSWPLLVRTSSIPSLSAKAFLFTKRAPKILSVMSIQGMELFAIAVVIILFVAVLKQFGILEPMSLEGKEHSWSRISHSKAGVDLIKRWRVCLWQLGTRIISHYTSQVWQRNL